MLWTTKPILSGFQGCPAPGPCPDPSCCCSCARPGSLDCPAQPSGRVWGIVVNDFFRRLAPSLSSMLLPSKKLATDTNSLWPPGAGSLVHALTAAAKLDAKASVLSLDGVGAFDIVSRQAMLEALQAVPGANRCLPFVRQFYASPTTRRHPSRGRRTRRPAHARLTLSGPEPRWRRFRPVVATRAHPFQRWQNHAFYNFGQKMPERKKTFHSSFPMQVRHPSPSRMPPVFFLLRAPFS